ncbi:hypothetical protein OEA41_003658 [Lepraria neglecta]|uniref:Uncharacterized protein n=1 Tax=Lepraria neglecta TaxID=209136 RepID=A0AAD9Z4X8_9LECA|nr:hypothetical protein OEA41_003658 [Lepraria neglecta]
MAWSVEQDGDHGGLQNTNRASREISQIQQICGHPREYKRQSNNLPSTSEILKVEEKAKAKQLVTSASKTSRSILITQKHKPKAANMADQNNMENFHVLIIGAGKQPFGKATNA